MNTDTISACLTDSVAAAPLASSATVDWWMWAAVAEAVIIVLLLFILLSRSKPDSSKRRFREEAIDGEIDFDNIIDSSFNAAALYDRLKVRCHPDRFAPDEEKCRAAETLFQEMTKNKTDIKRLLELKDETERTLNIKL